MAIQITCPGCHKRFQVSDKFAGKQGPCPNCKTVINIPKKEEEAVIHAPEEFGPKGKTGQAVLKPLARAETKFSPLVAGMVIAAVLLVFALALVVRFNFDAAEDPGSLRNILAFGAFALGPPLAFAGYTFLRDDELEPYRGRSLWIRVFVVGVVYALIWGIVGYWVKGYFLEAATLETFELAIVIPGMFLIGAFAAHAALDLDIATAALHYGFYLAVTVLLRLTMDLSVV